MNTLSARHTKSSFAYIEKAKTQKIPFSRIIDDQSPRLRYTNKYHNVSKKAIVDTTRKAYHVLTEFVAQAIIDFGPNTIVKYVDSNTIKWDTDMLTILIKTFPKTIFTSVDGEFDSTKPSVVIFLGIPKIGIAAMLQRQKVIIEKTPADRYGVYFAIPWSVISIDYYDGILRPIPFTSLDSSMCLLTINQPDAANGTMKKYQLMPFDERMFRYRVCDRDDETAARVIDELIIKAGGDISWRTTPKKEPSLIFYDNCDIYENDNNDNNN